MFPLSKKHSEIAFVLTFVASVVLVSFLFINILIKPAQKQLALLPQKKFVEPVIKAKSAYIYDVTDSRVLYEKNANKPMALASLTKVMTALVAKEQVPQDAEISIIGQGKLPVDYLASSTGEIWQRDELLRFMLFVSSNIAAESIDQEMKNENKGLVFLMNKKAKDLNLKTLSFSNASGLDGIEGQGSSYGSAKEIASLFMYATSLYPDLFEPTRYKEYNFISKEGNNHPGTNTNAIVDQVAGIYASKTGFTDLAGGNLAVGLEENGHKIVIVVLGSEKDGRFSDVSALAAESLNVISSSKVYSF